MSRRTGCWLWLAVVVLLRAVPEPSLAAAPAAADSAGGLFLTEVEFQRLPAGSDPVSLAHAFIDPISLQVQLDGVPLVQGRDFRLRGRSGVVLPLRDWAQLRPNRKPPLGQGLLVFSYRFQPVPLPPRRDLRRVGAGPESRPAGPGDVAPASTAAGNPAGGYGQLEVSGSKSVQVSSGSRRDMTVDQNLRLNIAGQLTEDISVRAFLSDDNLPVVPEGNTEKLRDIDKVLVELQGRRWSSTLGDFVARRGGTTFGDYRRKLQGVSVESRPGGQTVSALAGAPRGRYRTLQIRGQESNQGPYYLGSGSGGENLYIVAGSERVSLDGEVLTRGSDRDYVIDYVRGTVTFTYRRLITADSSILVEFEEGEGPYGRTVVGVAAGTGFTVPGLGAAGTLQIRLIREQDDPARLRTGELGDRDEAILAEAGDDAGLAVADGATASADTTGLYDRTEEDGRLVYVHAPDGGLWNVEFYYVGPGLGDYDLDFLTQGGQRIFVYRGDGAGSYRIGRPLALPVSHSMVTFVSQVGDTAGAYLGAEGDISQLDANRLSVRDDGDNQGRGLRLEAASGEGALRLGGLDLGKAGLKVRYTDRSDHLAPFQITKDIFAYEQWGLGARARREGFLQEKDRELQAALDWRTGTGARTAALQVRRGSLRHGAGLAADRTAAAGNWRLGGLTGRHRWVEAQARDSGDPLRITRNDGDHRLALTAGWLRPSVHYRRERWEDAARSVGTAGGYRLEQYGAQLAGVHGRVLTWDVAFTRGLADSLAGPRWRAERDSRTTKGSVTSGRLGGMRLVAEGTVRRTLSPGLPDQSTRLANLNLSGRWDRSATDWSLGYRVENSRAEVLDRQIVFVGDRQGDFDQEGRYLGDGQGDYDLVLAGTDSLVATTAVKADLNWRQGFGFLGRDRWYGAWSLLTLAGVEGRSTTDDTGGLLRLDPNILFDEATAVLGDLTLGEEFTLLQHLRRVDLRAKFDYRETMDRQYAAHPEQRLQRGWQVRGSAGIGAVSALQGRWQTKQENRFSTEAATSSRRSYQVASSLYELGWTYSPGPAVRVAVQGEHLRRRDAVTGTVQREYALRPTWRQRLRRDWTLQSDVRVATVDSREPSGVLRPWFFPQPGTNVEASLRLAWEPSKFLTVGGSWFARRQGERGWQHDLRLESTARF